MCRKMWIDSIQRESTMRKDVVRNMPSSVSLSKSSKLSNGYMLIDLFRQNGGVDPRKRENLTENCGSPLD